VLTYPAFALHATRETRTRLLRSPPGAGSLVRAAPDSVVAIAILAAAVSVFGAGFDGAFVILALLVFAMTFPDGLIRDRLESGDLMLEIATGWIAVVGLLALLGWATQTLAAFDERVILAWARLAHRDHRDALQGRMSVVGPRPHAVAHNDLAYLRSWSLVLDLQIILKTVIAVLRKQNAY
jgi:hypothetical protein